MAVGSDDPAVRARSFDILVRAYWKPVYMQIRMRWNRPAEHARDLTQAFFARAFEKQYFSAFDPARALFRTYIRTCLDRFIMEDARAERRQKRGGPAVRLSLDFDVAESELRRAESGAFRDPDTCFDEAWTRSLLADAVQALEETCASQAKDKYFAAFRAYVLDGDGLSPPEPQPGSRSQKPSYADLARQLGLSVTDVTNYLAWTRREFRRIVLDRLREITASDDEFRSEARAVLGIEP